MLRQFSKACLASVAVLAFVGVAQAVPVNVPNASFEEPDLAGSSGSEQFNNLSPASPPGWTFAFEAGTPASGISWGVQDPGAGFYGSAHPLPAPFDLNQIGFINLNVDGETVAVADSDPVGILSAGEIYTLMVAVGARNNAGWRDLDYSIGLVAADGTELGTFASATLDPGLSATEITDLTYTLDVDAEAAGSIGEQFFVRIRSANTGQGGTGGFTQANFDNVRLDVIPEPSSLMFLAGSLALVARRRRA